MSKQRNTKALSLKRTKKSNVRPASAEFKPAYSLYQGIDPEFQRRELLELVYSMPEYTGDAEGEIGTMNNIVFIEDK